MSNRTHRFKVTVTKPVLAACGVVAACLAPSAAADVVIFDNSGGEFQWDAWSWIGPTEGNLLDPTLGPGEQVAADPARSYASWRQEPTFSNDVVSYYISCGTDVSIARETEEVTVGEPSWVRIDLYLATTFDTRNLIGPDANWQPQAETGWYSIPAGGENPMLGQTPVIGIRLNLEDGPHYGFMRLALRERPRPPLSSNYQPISWGYETEPNTPLTVCPADLNLDFTLNSQDFFDFLGEFFNSGSRADFDGSGTINSQDFFAFLEAFFTGC